MEKDVPVHHGFVAEEGPDILGFATWKPVGDGTAELTWMGVVRERHRDGIGTALLDAVVEAAAGAGHGALDVSTVADSVDYPPYDPTRAFYRARGFADHRVDREFFGDEGDRYDRLLLRRPLRPGGAPP
jgi:GNAT superfamily N-acetyltransferase